MFSAALETLRWRRAKWDLSVWLLPNRVGYKLIHKKPTKKKFFFKNYNPLRPRGTFRPLNSQRARSSLRELLGCKDGLLLVEKEKWLKGWNWVQLWWTTSRKEDRVLITELATHTQVDFRTAVNQGLPCASHFSPFWTKVSIAWHAIVYWVWWTDGLSLDSQVFRLGEAAHRGQDPRSLSHPWPWFTCPDHGPQAWCYRRYNVLGI